MDPLVQYRRITIQHRFPATTLPYRVFFTEAPLQFSDSVLLPPLLLSFSPPHWSVAFCLHLLASFIRETSVVTIRYGLEYSDADLIDSFRVYWEGAGR